MSGRTTRFAPQQFSNRADDSPVYKLPVQGLLFVALQVDLGQFRSIVVFDLPVGAQAFFVMLPPVKAACSPKIGEGEETRLSRRRLQLPGNDLTVAIKFSRLPQSLRRRQPLCRKSM